MLTMELAQQYAEEVVAERGPDFVYAQSGDEATICAYVSQEDPRFPGTDNELAMRSVASGSGVTGCLVGEILKRADLLTDKVAGSQVSIGSLIIEGFVPVDSDETRLFLSALQISQDAGTNWGESLKCAKETIANRAAMKGGITANHDGL